LEKRSRLSTGDPSPRPTWRARHTTARRQKLLPIEVVISADGPADRQSGPPDGGSSTRSGACRTDDPGCELTMDDPKAVTAEFESKDRK